MHKGYVMHGTRHTWSYELYTKTFDSVFVVIEPVWTLQSDYRHTSCWDSSYC